MIELRSNFAYVSPRSQSGVSEEISVLSETVLPKVLAPLLMQGLTALVISMSTNLNVEAYNGILGNLIV